MKQVTTRTLGLTATLFGAAAPHAGAASVDAAPGFFFSTLPFNDSGSTVGLVSDINTLPSGVSNYTRVDGPDVFYSFTVMEAGTLTFTVTPQGQTGFDPSIYLLTGGTVGDNAFIGADAELSDEPETFTTGVLVPGTYYFVVDSYYSSDIPDELLQSRGAYDLSVTGTARIPEPGAAALGLASLGMVAWRRRRQGAR